MYLKNLTCFVHLTTRKDDFYLVKSNLRKIICLYYGVGVGVVVKVKFGSRSRSRHFRNSRSRSWILIFRLRNPGNYYRKDEESTGKHLSLTNVNL